MFLIQIMIDNKNQIYIFLEENILAFQIYSGNFALTLSIAKWKWTLWFLDQNIVCCFSTLMSTKQVMGASTHRATRCTF